MASGRRDLLTLTVLVLEELDEDALVVDWCLRRQLSATFIVIRLKDLDELLARIDDDPPDVILLDLAPAHHQGVRTLERVRQRTLLPVVVLASLPDPEFGLDALRHGAQEYLPKTELSPDRLQRSVIFAHERRRLERSVARQLTLAAIGRLAGGIAHDFNNLLAAILGHTELAALDTPPDSPAVRALGEVVIATQRAAQLTSRLQVVGERQIAQPVLIDLNDTVTEVTGRLRAFAPPGVALIVEAEQSPCSVRADPAHVRQALDEAILNAFEAMPGGGRVTVRISRVDLAGGAAHPDARPGVYCVVEVTDTGPGVERVIRGQLFEPFVTTKSGPNRGFGLALCYSIVKQHAGHIRIESEPGRGTTCSMRFPSADSDSSPSAEQLDREAPGGIERVLIVDDEPALLSLMQRALQALGYTVLVASSTTRAREIDSASEAPFDLLIVDVVMPEMPGPRLAELLRVETPTMRVLFVSGYAETLMGPAGSIQEGLQLLPKPFTLRELARRVRRVLDAATVALSALAPMCA
jgi:two-component system, cell cycle sensor histidine kinase and response regulator CckA